MSMSDQQDKSWTSTPLGRVAAPLRQQVTERLRSAITGLDLKPGQRLIERELMEQLGVSRTTIREALRELSSEGLVTVVPQRGAIVTKPTHDEAADLYEVRASLESLLVQRFIERGTDAELEQLRFAAANYRAVSENQPNDIVASLAAKNAIYAVLIAGARSEPLRQLIEQIQARVHVMRATSLSYPGRAREAVAEIDGIVAAVSDRNVSLATQLNAAHVRNAARTALSAFDS